MTYAAITGWGKCMPPAILDNAGLATFLDTTDDWITSRTGIRERRISHVPMTVLSHIAAARALACAGLDPADVDLIVLGTVSADEHVPNTASAVQILLGANNAAAMDINTACTSFLYGLTSASAMVRTGVVRNAVVIGVEGISPYMDWSNRNVAVLFGDGAAAVVIQASDKPEGVIAEKLGCYADARHTLRVRGMGAAWCNHDLQLGDTRWDFDGQEIFKRAVVGMSDASESALQRAGVETSQVDLVIPHQANLRIIEAVAKRAGLPMDRVFVTVQRYGNMSSATVPVALVEAIEEGRVKPGSLLLTPAFGAGLTWCAHVIRWGDRVTPLGTSDLELPPCDVTGVELVQDIIRRKGKTAEGFEVKLAAK
ncbi:3-oxoacyl-[acyl-carrier-protein] synthase-3 [Povalibacter uvarum]|uniref:Beta-ketoacyl-[acyl-carrier-protein] synthase III n=1 Tax=Povalibacter uvarum TaxID=732238 RepID=A0A841HMP2_9GAMM|nr:ketoacyl-ACP synthase III [Povalibacter uvarum]MBB6094146.1 3-oxoacyl-[acyl-carrier-protein] synthase-3 [Povalibacter uvarum]